MNLLPKILLIEDDLQIRRFLRVTLPANGYELLEAERGMEGVRMTASHNPDLVILDLGLPDIEGIEVLRRLREWTAVPVVVLTARGQDEEKVATLDAGADDYLTKPFSMAELLARLRVALRHASGTTSDSSNTIVAFGDVSVDLSSRLVQRGETEIHLTRNEYRLLAMLCKFSGKVLTHRQLLKEVWGPNNVEHTQYLRVFMASLRQKLESDPSRPRYLLTEPGVGYRLKLE